MELQFQVFVYIILYHLYLIIKQVIILFHKKAGRTILKFYNKFGWILFEITEQALIIEFSLNSNTFKTCCI